MGFFSNIRNKPSTESREAKIAKGLITMPILTAAADGSIDEAEKLQILNMVAFSPVFGVVGVEATGKLIEEVLTGLKTKGAQAVFEDAIEPLSPALRETALCFAIRAALADGVLENSEKDMLVALGQRMGLPPESFMKIFDVMCMLQRGPNA